MHHSFLALCFLLFVFIAGPRRGELCADSFWLMGGILGVPVVLWEHGWMGGWFRLGVVEEFVFLGWRIYEDRIRWDGIFMRAGATV